MKPDTIRRIDRWVGVPVCFALSALRRVTRPVRGTPAGPGVPRKILFIRMTEQGAIVLAASAITRAIEMVGRGNVFFLVFEENRPILDLMGLIPAENVLQVRAVRPGRLVIDLLRCLRRIRRERIDAVVDLEFFARASAILAILTGARVRVGLHRFTVEGPYRGDLMTHRFQYNPFLHTATAYLLEVECLLADPAQRPMPKRALPQADLSPPRFEPMPQDLEDVRRLLEARFGRRVSRPIVLLNPNAGDMLPLRKWPAARYEDLARILLREHKEVTVVVTGAPAERAEAEAVTRGLDPTRATSLAGHTSLRQLLALYALSDVLVTNDSGPAHFASMTDIDTVALFGPETPGLFGPLGARAHVITARLACSPCVSVLNHRHSPCNDNVCMQAIDVEEVYRKVRALLEARARAREQSA